MSEGLGRIGIRVVCARCGYTKKPIGRDASPLGGTLCDDDCEGYRLKPFPGSLWPGETSDQFGYPVGDHGTKPIESLPSPPETEAR